jgi:hypothetical protein
MMREIYSKRCEGETETWNSAKISHRKSSTSRVFDSVKERQSNFCCERQRTERERESRRDTGLMLKVDRGSLLSSTRLLFCLFAARMMVDGPINYCSFAPFCLPSLVIVQSDDAPLTQAESNHLLGHSMVGVEGLEALEPGLREEQRSAVTG